MVEQQKNNYKLNKRDHYLCLSIVFSLATLTFKIVFNLATSTGVTSNHQVIYYQCLSNYIIWFSY